MTNRFESVLNFEQLPLMVGTRETPTNGTPLPDTLPFELVVEIETAQLRQVPNPRLEHALDYAYQAGSILGTAMDDTPLGARYCDDVLGFIRSVLPDLRGRRVLEIGAGRGFLLRRLRDLGATTVGLEPGEANRPYWETHGVEIVTDYFPSKECPGPFDLIVAHAVLEHVPEPEVMLREMRGHLEPDGIAIVGVPNDEPDILAGDPAMLVHEHFSYFTGSVLRRVIRRGGFEVLREARSELGGTLYAAGAPTESSPPSDKPTVAELAQARAFGERCKALRSSIEGYLARSARTPLGIYCPARGVNLLPADGTYRFFDDDASLHGRYYPPFVAPVESRDQLLANPTEELWILSRTFGKRLAAELRTHDTLNGTRIQTIAGLEASFDRPSPS